MKRLLMIAAMVIALPAISLCQSAGQSPSSNLLKDVSVESVPLLDTLTDEKRTGQSSQQVKSGDDEHGRFWVSAEYLLWKMKRSNLPPLITTGPENGSAVIGQLGTAIAFGGDKLERGKFPGGRFTAGVWLNEKRSVGVELSYFFLKERTFRFEVTSSGQPGSQVITRPYFNVSTGKESGLVIVLPPFPASGSSTATLPSSLKGGEVNLIYRLNRVHCCRTSLQGGFRYLDLNEQLNVIDTEDSVFGRHFTDTDQFSTRNQFYGGQVGVRSAFNRGRLSLELSGAAALGSNRESVEINGATSDSFNLPNNRRGGVLALVSNIGLYQRNEFTIVPEVRANLGYDITHKVRAFIGYGFLYWNKVVRPGEQIDRVVNPLLVPSSGSPVLSGPLRPAFTLSLIHI